MNNETLKVIEHIKNHTSHPEINNIPDAIRVLYEIFNCDNERNTDVLQCPLCQNCLAIGYWRNINGLKDNKKAYELLRKAADAGLAKAQANLGVVIKDKIFEKPDYRAAQYWYRKAAELNDGVAVEELIKYKHLFPEILSEQTHGDHLTAASFKDIRDIISDIIEKGVLECKTKTFVYDETEYPEYRNVFSLDLGNQEIRTRALIMETEKNNTLVSIYPYSNNGIIYEVKIDKIYEWENGIEATIAGYTNDNYISFFMADYYRYKNDIKQGDTLKFNLCVFAYHCKHLEKNSFQLEGIEALDFLNKIGEKSEIGPDGDIKPIVFNLDNMVAFIQTNKNYPDDVEYQSPIVSIKEINTNEGVFFKFLITAFRDPDFTIPLYVKHNLIDFTPEINMPILGVGWLQGCLEIGD